MPRSSDRRRDPVRLLVVPGLHDSGPTHWQSWLQQLYRGARRVEQDDWHCPDVDRWAARIGETLAAEPPGRWVVAAHSFGCLAMAEHLRHAVPNGANRIEGVMCVAPASPRRLGIDPARLAHPIGAPGVVVGSDSDPWMPASEARAWARHWGLSYRHLGDAGHINAEAGFGPLPPARHIVDALIARAERQGRLARADVRELSFAR